MREAAQVIRWAQSEQLRLDRALKLSWYTYGEIDSLLLQVAADCGGIVKL